MSVAASLPASPMVMGAARKGLLARRKLALFLDIDHTILHAIGICSFTTATIPMPDKLLIFSHKIHSL